MPIAVIADTPAPRPNVLFLAMITIIDHGLGRIFEALDRKGISDNTLTTMRNLLQQRMADASGSPSGRKQESSP